MGALGSWVPSRVVLVVYLWRLLKRAVFHFIIGPQLAVGIDLSGMTVRLQLAGCLNDVVFLLALVRFRGSGVGIL